jgi:hypothetical protein
MLELGWSLGHVLHTPYKYSLCFLNLLFLFSSSSLPLLFLYNHQSIILYQHNGSVIHTTSSSLVTASESTTTTNKFDIADRQNAHNMGIAIRSILAIFKLAGKHTQLHQRLLTYSISHDDEWVRMDGWYPIFDGDRMTIHCHHLYRKKIFDQSGENTCRAFSFSLKICEYALELLHEINTIIDELPNPESPPIGHVGSERFRRERLSVSVWHSTCAGHIRDTANRLLGLVVDAEGKKRRRCEELFLGIFWKVTLNEEAK